MTYLNTRSRPPTYREMAEQETEAGRRYAEMVHVCSEKRRDDVELLRILREIKGDDMEWDEIREDKDAHGTFLMWTARLSRFNSISGVLISEGAHVQRVDDEGSTVLHHAVSGDNLEGVQQILDHAVHPQERTTLLSRINNNGDYSLAFAVSNHNREMVHLLLSSGARVLTATDARAPHKPPPTQVLHQAADWAHDTYIFRQLMEDLKSRDKYTSPEVDHLIHVSFTFCPTHHKRHTLWKFLLSGAHENMIKAAISLSHDRGIRYPPEALSYVRE